MIFRTFFSLILFVNLPVFASDNRLNFLNNQYSLFEGPNCWNSVLYLKGISPSINYSDGEMVFWLNSPLCEQTIHAQKGDIVDFAVLNETGDNYNTFHSYLYLSDKIGFTKNGPDKEENYHMTSHEDVAKFYELDFKNCSNKSYQEGIALNCEEISTYYRCKDFSYLIKNLENDALYSEVSRIGDDLTKMIFSNYSFNMRYKARLNKIRNIAKVAIGVPSFKELSITLQTSIVENLNLGSDGPLENQFLDYITEIVYLNSYSLQRYSLEKTKMYRVVLDFRKEFNYSIITMSKFYYWAHIANTTRNMLYQLE